MTAAVLLSDPAKNCIDNTIRSTRSDSWEILSIDRNHLAGESFNLELSSEEVDTLRSEKAIAVDLRGRPGAGEVEAGILCPLGRDRILAILRGVQNGGYSNEDLVVVEYNARQLVTLIGISLASDKS